MTGGGKRGERVFPQGGDFAPCPDSSLLKKQTPKGSLVLLVLNWAMDEVVVV